MDRLPEPIAIAREKRAALLIVEPLQERLKGRAGEPVGDALRSVERMDIGRHPDVDPRASRPQPPVVILKFGDHGCVLAIGTRRDDQGPSAATMRISACEDSRALFGIWAANTPPGAIEAETGKQPVMIGQEMQRRIGEDEVWLCVRFPTRDVRLDEPRRRYALPCVASIASEVSRPTIRASGKRCAAASAVARTAAQIIYEAGRGERNLGEKIARRAHPLVFELGVEG